MKNPINRSYKVIILLSLLLTACANMASTTHLNRDEKFEKIKLGDKKQQVEAVWGATEIERETYPSGQVDVLNYTDQKKQPSVFFTIDPKNQQVIGKSKWIYSNDSLYDLKTLLENKFKDVKMTTYSPCTTRGKNEKIFINKEKGIYIASIGPNTDMVSWMTADFISLVVEGLYKKCPQLQPKKR